MTDEEIEKLFDDILSQETPQEYDEQLLIATKLGFVHGFKTALSVIEKAVRDEKKANMNALADLIGNNILNRIKQATFDKANK